MVASRSGCEILSVAQPEKGTGGGSRFKRE
jgi:hypothetical protein